MMPMIDLWFDVHLAHEFDAWTHRLLAMNPDERRAADETHAWVIPLSAPFIVRDALSDVRILVNSWAWDFEKRAHVIEPIALDDDAYACDELCMKLFWFYNTRHYTVKQRRVSRREQGHPRYQLGPDNPVEIVYTITVKHSDARRLRSAAADEPVRPLDYAVMKLRHTRTFKAARFVNVRGQTIVIEPHPSKYGVPIVSKKHRFVAGAACGTEP